MHMCTAILAYSQLEYIYKISLSQNSPLARLKKRKGTPQHLASALTVCNMLLLGFIQAKKRELSHLRRHIYKYNDVARQLLVIIQKRRGPLYRKFTISHIQLHISAN